MRGGVITHELGQRHNSPTVNLYMLPTEFIRFVSNLDYYLSCEIEEVYTENTYPVGRIDDVRLYFVHYTDFEAAKKKWKERCKRVNRNNIYVIMCERDGCTYEDLLHFDKLQYAHKVVFTAREYPQIHSSYHIPGTNLNGEVRDICAYKSKKTAERWIDDFDFIDFLNQGCVLKYFINDTD